MRHCENNVKTIPYPPVPEVWFADGGGDGDGGDGVDPSVAS